MSPPIKRWSFRRWRRRWNERVARWTRHWNMWVDKHIVSYKSRQAWRRRWKRRSEKLGSKVEQIGFKLLPHQPEAATPSRWAKLQDKIDGFIDSRYPPETRLRHFRAWREVWREFTSPIRWTNRIVRRWLGNFLIPALTPAGFRRQFFNWRGALGGVGTLGLISWIFLWLVPHWKLHNEHKWELQARLLLNRGYLFLASQTAQRILRHNEHNEEACRVYADLCERQGLPVAVEWRRKVVECTATDSNKLALAATSVKFEPPPSSTASRVLSELSGGATNLALYHVVYAQFESRNGNQALAESHYREALAQDPNNAETALSLALVQLQSRQATNIESGEAKLVSLAEKSETSIRALRALASITASRGELDRALAYSQRILDNESASFEDRLAHLQILLRRRDPLGPVYLGTLQQQVSSNPQFVNQLAMWMVGQDRAREAITWLGSLPPAIRRSDQALVAAADAYTARADWQGMIKFLRTERQNWGTIEYIRQALLARAYRGLGDQPAYKENFDRAKELAAGMYLRLSQFTDTIIRWGWTDEVEGLLWELFNRYPTESRAPTILLGSYFQKGNTDGLRRIFERQLTLQTNDVSLMNNLAIVLLLQKRDMPRAHQLAQTAFKRMPESAVHVSTYAYSLTCQNRAAEARKLMESLGPDMLKVPSMAAYYAIICDALGDRQTSKEYLVYARQATLLPEERGLLEEIRNRH